METDLNLTLEQFDSLPQREKWNCLYQNVSEIKVSIKSYTFWYRLYTIIGSFILCGVGWLFIDRLGGV